MMDEMAKTLARRRAAAENKDVVSNQQVSLFRVFYVSVMLYVNVYHQRDDGLSIFWNFERLFRRLDEHCLMSENESFYFV